MVDSVQEAQVVTAGPVEGDRARGRGFAWFAARYGVLVALFLLVVLFGALRPHSFLSWANALTILQLASPLAVISFGVTLPMAVGDFDLSIGGMMSFTSAITVVLMVDYGVGYIPAILIGLVVGAAAGAANGIATAYLGASSFVITLASGQMLLGGQYLVTDQSTIFQGIPKSFISMSRGNNIIVFAVILGLLLWVFLSKSEPGRVIYAVGINPTAARFAGLRVKWWRLVCFAVVAVCASLGGILISSQAASEPLGFGTSYLLPAYAAVFLGSVVLQPGRFTIVGTAVGVLFLQVLETGLAMLSLPNYTVLIIQGGVLIVAILMSRLGARKGGV